MDLFEKYFKELVAGEAKTPWHSQMATLNAAAVMLKYPEHRNRTLRFLAKMLWQMGHAGEAYQAARALPPEEVGDAVNIIQALEESLPRALNTTIEIITKCNLRCPLCGGDENLYKPHANQVMPLKMFQKIWNRVVEHTSLAILVGGGESFLHPQIYEILDFIKPTPVHVDTNGCINMDHERIVRSSLKTLIFSVDGVDQRTHEQYRVGGNFHRVIENIKAAVAAKKKYGRGPDIIFKYIIFRHNEAYLTEAARLAQELGVDRFQTNPCNCSADVSQEIVRRFIPVGRESITRIDHIDYGSGDIVPVKSMDTPLCLTPLQNPYIQIDGTFRPCCALRVPGFKWEPQTEEERREAAWWREEMNILNNRLEDLWRVPPLRDFRIRALQDRYAEPAYNGCLFPVNTLGRVFDGTELEPPRRKPSSEDILKIKDLRIEADYAAWLLENGLSQDIQYYRESGALSPEAEALLSYPKVDDGGKSFSEVAA